MRIQAPRGAFGERHIRKLAFDRTAALNPTNPKQRAVVKAARVLLSEWSMRRKKVGIQQALTPEMHMVTRRKKIRRALESMPCWTVYEKATTNVYGV